MDHGGTLEGLLSERVPQNQPRRVNIRVHLGVLEGKHSLAKSRKSQGPFQGPCSVGSNKRPMLVMDQPWSLIGEKSSQGD